MDQLNDKYKRLYRKLKQFVEYAEPGYEKDIEVWMKGSPIVYKGSAEIEGIWLKLTNKDGEFWINIEDISVVRF